MDTKKLEALLTAVELGSFTRAAEVLGYTQSGLTHMMNSLEKDIGFTVLLRGRSGVRLTPAGQRILPLVRDCLGTTAALEREISLINTHKEDSVRVAAYESIARHWLPEIIQQFRREHPDVTVDIQMTSCWPSCRRSTTAGKRPFLWRPLTVRNSLCPPWALTRISSAC